MKKISSQILIGTVCMILGFMMAYQFKIINGQGNKILAEETTQSYYDLNADNEQLKKVKEELLKENNKVLEELKKYEDNAASKNSASTDVKKQLDDSRILLGMTDVEGPGVTIYLTPKSSIFNNIGYAYVNYKEIAYLINELYFARAEAIAINDNRIVSQSVIKASNNSELLIVNDDKISPKNRIVIKAIGNKEKLEEYLNFPDVLDFQALVNYDIKIEKSDSIKIPKYNKNYNNDFLKLVEKK